MKKKEPLYARRIETVLLTAVTLLLAVMATTYYFNTRKDFKDTDEAYRQETAINLAAPLNETVLKKILLKGGYFTDDRYISFIAGNLEKILERQGQLPNLGALNKKEQMLDATLFTKTGSESGELRFINSLVHLGMDSALYSREKTQPPPYSASVPVQQAETGISIKGKVKLDAENTSAKGILIKLTEIFSNAYFDSLPPDERPVQTEFYARTDDNGNYSFQNLKPKSNYSVLPLRPGCEFGVARGKAAISGDQRFDFTGRPHQLKLLDRVEYRQIKNDKVFTVRTPADFQKEFFTWVLLFAAGFWLFHLALWLKNYRSDQFILPLIMLITGTGMIVLYSIQDPLRDEIYATEMAQYSFAVLLLFSALVFLFKHNPVNRFYHSRWFDPVHQLLSQTENLKVPRGYTWLLASILIMLMVAVFGTGPEGSGVKVNLFGFQVSELSKYLMIVFFAAYFAVNADYFRNITDNRWLTRHNILMLVLFVFLLGVYAALGDLGPAIVLCLTFLFFYSFAKDEFFQMILAAAIFAFVLWVVGRFINNGQHDYLPWVSLAAVAGSFLYAFLKKKHESVFFIVMIMASFILLATLPFEFTQRLADRNGMFRNMWENQLIGGDQVAQGVWSLNAGGLLGQGLGNGFSNVMPAHHTDMIVQSIGEELGLLSLVAIFVAFGLLVYRCILAARRTGKPFMFYLMAGIAIATMLQFALIVAGTLGLIPLTGISVPFLSKGNAGIILTLMAFCFIIVMSHEKGDALEMDYVKTRFDHVNTYAILSFFGIVVVFTGALTWYQLKSNQYIVKPALVLNRNGEWQYTYNPRIGIMLREIKAGNIYDKNGVLLATSDKNIFRTFKNRLVPLGANAALYDEQLTRNQKRYYPFGADLIFWLGDYNKEIAREESIGYAAEFRHFTMLRGFDVSSTTTQKTSDRYKENRFLPETEKESELTLYDYSALAPFIKAGKNSAQIAAQNQKPRDIQLSIDVAMNAKINRIVRSNPQYKNFRTSVVALNARTGDVLASALNPAPSYKDLKLISNIDVLEYRDIFRQIFNDRMVVPQDLGITFNSRPGSTVKIIDAYAAMNQYGTGAANFSYFIEPGEIIRPGEPVNENVDMHKAIVRSSNVYFIKLANEKKLQSSLFNMYDALGMNILNRGGFHFQRPEDYNSNLYFTEWNRFLSVGKNIYNSKKLAGSRKRFASRYSDIAWGQGELMATPLQLAKMSGVIANRDTLQPHRFLIKSWSREIVPQKGVGMAKQAGIGRLLGSFMREQSAAVAAATGLEVAGKTGSPERDKLLTKGNTTTRKRVTDAWYTFYVPSPKLNAPVAFAIRIEEIGNSDFAKDLAKDILAELKASGYF